jgi:hypothetical protein
VVRTALRSSHREFDAESLVRAMVFNRLCAPDSSLGFLDWLQTAAIPGMPKTVLKRRPARRAAKRCGRRRP